jgi:uncharacterized SAM-binding protein YcdF (DUF218 family)
MDDGFRWKMLFKALILPPAAPLVVALVGLLIWRRHPRTGRALTAAGLLALFLLSLPVVATLLIRAVDASPPLDLARAAEAQAIVILGGGVRRNALEYGGATVNRLTLERLRYGARVARALELPVLVSGGRSAPSLPSEAELMRGVLQAEYGVPVRWAEDRSTNTHENAVMSAAVLRAAGIGRVVLVAHGFDMPRATAEFAAAGIETIRAPTGVPLPAFTAVLDYVPSAEALQGSYYALYEMFANVALRFRRAFQS